MAFKDLKKNRGKGIEKLVDAAEKIKKGGSEKSFKDDRFWTPTIDKAGNGYAVIRFLPAPEGEESEWVRYWDHGFQGPSGLWYIEKSLTSIGLPDPVSEANSELWNSGIEANKEVARDRKRRLHYVSNIYVLSDPSNPDSEGKAWLFAYGKKLFEKITSAAKPEFEDETPIDAFDLWEGADFKLKIRKVDGYRNYDKSEFAEPSALLDGDDSKLEAVYKAEHSLQELIAPSVFKSYDELKERFERVMLISGGGSATATAEAVSEARRSPTANSAMERASVSNNNKNNDDDDADGEEVDNSGDEGGDTLSYFAKLAANQK